MMLMRTTTITFGLNSDSYYYKSKLEALEAPLFLRDVLSRYTFFFIFYHSKCLLLNKSTILIDNLLKFNLL